MQEFINQWGFLIVSMLLAAILALSTYLPLMAGQLSLASPGFYALGGYVAAVMSTRYLLTPDGSTLTPFPVPLLLVEMIAAALVCAALAVVIGIPALRLRGIYLALATIAFVEILRVLSLNLDITGGAIGIFKIPQPFERSVEYLWIALPMLLVCAFFVYRLERSRVGRALTALREDELAASAMGINPTYYKVLAFTLGAIVAGVVGAVSAHFINTWNARQGTFDLSIAVLAFVLIGGSRTFLGPIVGGMVLTWLPEGLRQLSNTFGDQLPPLLATFLKDGRYIIYGLLIAISVQFFPHGLITPALFKRRALASETDAALPAKRKAGA